MLQIDKHLFHRNLLLTQQYCELQLANTEKNHASILRSINPLISDKPVFEFGFVTSFNCEAFVVPEIRIFDFHSKWAESPFATDSFVVTLFEEQLQNKTALAIGRGSEFEGEILVVWFSETIVDGVSQGESRGFIDEYDFPPIDTWFYKAEGADGPILFAWIPKQFTWLVEQAAAVNLLDMMEWFSKRYPEDYTSIMA